MTAKVVIESETAASILILITQGGSQDKWDKLVTLLFSTDIKDWNSVD